MIFLKRIVAISLILLFVSFSVQGERPSREDILSWLKEKKGFPFIVNGHLTDNEHIEILKMVFNKTYPMRIAKREYYAVFFFNKKFKLVKKQTVAKGDYDSVRVPTDKIVRLSKSLKAPILIGVHNHPTWFAGGWECRPSDIDFNSTALRMKKFKKNDIILLDECVVSGNRLYSMRTNNSEMFRNHHPKILDELK